jgi:hypothetical protein
MNLLPQSKNTKTIINADGTTSIIKNENGQTFLEFLLILLVMMGMSFTMLRGFNGGIGARWVSLVKVIAKPNPGTIELR